MKSRYEDVAIIKQNDIRNDINSEIMRLATFPSIKASDIISNNDTFYSYRSTDRLDDIAYKHYGEGRYWWIICIANNLVSPFDKGLVPGKQIRIPANVDKIFNVIKSKTSRFK